MIGVYQKQRPLHTHTLDHSSTQSFDQSSEVFASDSKPTLFQASCSNLSTLGSQSPSGIPQSTSVAAKISTGSDEALLGAAGGIPTIREDIFTPKNPHSRLASTYSSSRCDVNVTGTFAVTRRFIFDKALEEIHLLMSNDPYQRYLKSDAYSKLLNEPPLVDRPTELHRVQK